MFLVRKNNYFRGRFDLGKEKTSNKYNNLQTKLKNKILNYISILLKVIDHIITNT